MTSRFVFGTLFVLATFPAGAQGYSIQEQEACTGDAFRLCQSAIPDIPRITACLEGKKAELSPGCQRMFDPGRDRHLDAPAVRTIKRRLSQTIGVSSATRAMPSVGDDDPAAAATAAAMPTTSQIATHHDPADIVIEGYLAKRGEHLKTWRQRYFILFRDGALLGFRQKMEDANYSSPLNVFTVKDIELLKAERPRPNIFLLRGLHWTSSIVRRFCTETPEQRDVWMCAIQHVAGALKTADVLASTSGGGGCDIELMDVGDAYTSEAASATVASAGAHQLEQIAAHEQHASDATAQLNVAGVTTGPAAASTMLMRAEPSLPLVGDAANGTRASNAPHFDAVRPPIGINGRPLLSGAVNQSRSLITLDDFEFLKVLGKGTFGKVLLCREKRTSELYAIKILKKEVLVAKDEVTHTYTENRVLQRCRHPFLTQMIYTFQTVDRLFFVCEFAGAGDLYFHLNQNVQLRKAGFSEERSRFYGAEITLALGYLHDNNIVYRDLKLENLLLDRDGHVKIADFGLCKEGIKHDDRTSTFCGTPEYLAPEVLEDSNYGRSVDWWGLGVVLYEMMCGRLPFFNKDHEKLFSLILSSNLRFPSALSSEARSLLSGLLIKDPSLRLGGGADDWHAVAAQEFFRSIDWDKLYRREYEVPFKPNLVSDTDTQYFDSEFTREPVQLTPPPCRGGALETVEENSELQSNFVHFSFRDTYPMSLRDDEEMEEDDETADGAQ